MNYIVTTEKSVEEAIESLRKTIAAVKFGILHIHNLKQKMNDKGIPFEHECQVLEVCNPVQANKVLSIDMSLNMALPCRISVYEEDGVVKIGMLSPQALLTVLSDNQVLRTIATDVELALKEAIDNAK